MDYERKLTWQSSGLFNDKSDIYDFQDHIGSIETTALSKKDYGYFRGEKIIFKNDSFWNNNYKLIKESTKEIIGKIYYKNFSLTPYLIFRGEKYSLKNKNILSQNMYLLNENKEKLALYDKSLTSGKISTDLEDDELIFLGLFFYFNTLIVNTMV